MRRLFTGAVAALALSVGVGGAAVAQDIFAIGTGGVTGVYFPAGGAICHLVNRGSEEHGALCAVESTGGSVANIAAIQDGGLDFGVVQSDWQHHAYRGSSTFAGRQVSGLRSVLSLHPEPFTVVARADSGIRSFDDLIGKRVNVGNLGSGQRGTMEVLMAAKGWTMDDFALAAEYPAVELPQQLCDGNIDAYVYMVGHPSTNVKQASTTCDVRLAPVLGREVDALVRANPFYRYATIPGGMYRGTNREIRTFGVGATLATSSSVSADVVYVVAKTVMQNLADFKQLHPAFANLRPNEMVQDGLSAPLHPGAERAFRELGLR